MIDLGDNIGRYIAVTWRQMAARLAKKLEPYGVGAGQYPYLFNLYMEDGQSQQSLADRLLVDKAATVRAINSLEKQGYVKRVRDTSDGRSYRIFLTRKAKDSRKEIEKLVEETLDVLQMGMDEAEKRKAKELLETMARNLLAGQ